MASPTPALATPDSQDRKYLTVRKYVREFFVDIFGSLVPGFLFTVIAALLVSWGAVFLWRSVGDVFGQDPFPRDFVTWVEAFRINWLGSRRVLRFEFVVQSGPYGNGTPLLNAGHLLNEAPCIYAFADDVIYGENISKRLILANETTGDAVLAAQEINPARRSSFGILEVETVNGVKYATRFIEKPPTHATKSTLASLGRYLVSPSLLRRLQSTPQGRNGELWFSDAVVGAIQDNERICVVATAGKWCTVGDPSSYAEAVQTFAGK
jgi:dTDP-glucose pyrophosphorylase